MSDLLYQSWKNWPGSTRCKKDIQHFSFTIILLLMHYAIVKKVCNEMVTNVKISMSVKYQHLKILACQNSIQHVVISMDLLEVNLILDMRVIPWMENVESYRHKCKWKNKVQTNAPKIQNVKVIEIIRGVAFYSGFVRQEIPYFAFYSGFQ